MNSQKVINEINTLTKHLRLSHPFILKHINLVYKTLDSLHYFYQLGRSDLALKSLPYIRFKSILDKEYNKLES